MSQTQSEISFKSLHEKVEITYQTLRQALKEKAADQSGRYRECRNLIAKSRATSGLRPPARQLDLAATHLDESEMLLSTGAAKLAGDALKLAMLWHLRALDEGRSKT